MKICVLGNSHVGALRLGWDRIADRYPDARPHFFGLSHPALSQTRLDDGALTPTRPDIAERMRHFSGGWDRIPLAEHDAFILSGVLVGLPRVLRYLGDHAIAEEARDRRQIVPRGMLQAAWDEQVAASPLPHLVGLIRQVTPAPILDIMRPLLSSALLAEDSRRGAWYRARVQDADAGHAHDLLHRLMQPHLNGAMACLPQPQETTVAGVLTHERFSTGSTVLRDLGRPHGPDDVSHMNAEYGAIRLEQAFDALGLVPQARATITDPTE